MKKRILSLLLTLLLAVGLSVPAFAGGEIDLDYAYLSVNEDGASYPLADNASGTGWQWDAASRTLTLTNYNGSNVEFNGHYEGGYHIKVVLTGANTINGALWFYKFVDENGGNSLEISGTGSLSVTGGLNTPGGPLTVQSGAIAVNDASPYGNGLYAESLTMNGGILEILPQEAGGLPMVLNGGLVKYSGGGGMYERYGWSDPIAFNGGSLSVDAWLQITNYTGEFTVTAADGSAVPADGGNIMSESYPITLTSVGATVPVQPEEPEQPAADTAYATRYSILVDGAIVAFDAYALKDENGNDTNYLKLRDVAYVLNGTQAQFDVGWDGGANAISIATGAVYASPNGSEMSTPFSGDQPYTENKAAVLVDGVEAGLEAITITDADGNGYTYFKLRDLGAALGFNVTWDADAGAIVIDTTQDYQG